MTQVNTTLNTMFDEAAVPPAASTSAAPREDSKLPTEVSTERLTALAQEAEMTGAIADASRYHQELVSRLSQVVGEVSHRERETERESDDLLVGGVVRLCRD
jgi:hypothetical protein